MTIYDIPSILRDAWPIAVTPVNILKRFEVTGISPYNPNVFQDDDFSPAFVTDRAMPPEENNDSAKNKNVAERRPER